MDAFHWIVVPISTVLGLSIARVLGGYATAIKGRRGLKFDWLSPVFAGAILGVALQFWWALLELSARPTWTLPEFTLLVAMIMSLFAAAALVSPAEGETDLRAAFERDGRLALLALALFHLLALMANVWLFGGAPVSFGQALQIVLAAICVTAGLSTRRRIHEAAAVLYVLLSVADTLIASAGAY